MSVLGVFASVSFSQFISLFFKDPTLSLGVFILIVSYYSFFTFKLFFPIGYILPNMFFCYALVSQIINKADPPVIGKGRNLTLQQLSAILIVQTVVYFILSLWLDQYRRGTLCKKRVLTKREFTLVRNPPIVANFKHKDREVSYEFEIQEGRVTCLLGATSSGKSQIMNLLTGLSRQNFKGSCFVKQHDLLKGNALPANQVGVCLEQQNLEESFTLFYHLCFIGQLRGLSNRQMLRQIFYLSKLFQIEDQLVKRISQLSGGNKRKAALSATLLGAPPLLIVDEPTRSLDPAVAREVLIALHFFVHKLGRAFIFSTKKASEVMLIADSVIALPSRSEVKNTRITDQQIQQKQEVWIKYWIFPEKYEAVIELREVRLQLKEILLKITKNEGHIIEMGITNIQTN